ncbi:MAG TPA: OmpA family protein [Polyangiaceae bacterium]|nr:OmpA family protein [Polyangiaceae bacterium]
MSDASTRLTLLLAGALLFAPHAGRAADGLALDRFQPSPAGDRFLGVPSAYVPGDFDLHAALLFDYAYKPLSLEGSTAQAPSFVTYQAVAHVNLTLALRKKVLLNLDVPALSFQEGQTSQPTHPVDFGDIRLGGRALLFGRDRRPFQLAFGSYFWLPSATGASSGDGKVRGLPYLSASGLAGPVVWTSLLGVEFRFSQLYEGVVRQGSSLNGGVGLGYLVDEQRKFQLGIEATASFVLSQPSSQNFNAELLFAGRYRFLEQVEAGLGVGPGLSDGVGTPTVRMVTFLSYVPVAVLNPPSEPAFNDRSGEGLVARSRTSSVFVAPESTESTESRAAPLLESPPKTPNDAPLARIEGNEIALSDPGLLFANGSVALDARGEWQLHAVADLLISHPEIRRIEIRGQADLHGTLHGNQRLGARRAEAVRLALIHHSVAPERLLTKSDGPSAPAAPSTSSDGLSRNRRVVFDIVERAPVSIDADRAQTER